MGKLRNAALLLGLTIAGSSAAFAQSTEDAMRAIDAEQYAKAGSLLKRLIASRAADAQNYYYLGEVYLKQDYTDSAKAVFNRGVQADSKNPLNYIGLGEVERLKGNAAGAQTYFAQAMPLIKKKDYAPNLAMGRAYLAGARPDYNAALAQFKVADEIDKDDKDPMIFTAYGDAYAMQRKNSDALAPYMQAVNLAGNQYRAKVQIARMYKESRAFAEAENQLKDVISKAPTYGPAYRELAELYYTMGRLMPGKSAQYYPQAINAYKQYMANTDSSVESRMRYLTFLTYAKDWKTIGQETSQLAASIKPSDPNYRVLKRLQGYSAIENGQTQQGQQALQELITNAGDASKIIPSDYYYLGKAQFAAGNKAEGIKNMKQAVVKDSTNADEFAELGIQLYKDKDFKGAADVLETATTAKPNGVGSLYNFYYKGLAYYFDYAADLKAKRATDKDRLQKADAAFNRVIKDAPETADAYLWSARANQLMDDDNSRGLAEPIYEKYINLVTVTKPEMAAQPTSKAGMVEAYNYMAAYSAKKGNSAGARGYYEKARAIDPTNANTINGLKALK